MSSLNLICISTGMVATMVLFATFSRLALVADWYAILVARQSVWSMSHWYLNEMKISCNHSLVPGPCFGSIKIKKGYQTFTVDNKIFILNTQSAPAAKAVKCWCANVHSVLWITCWCMTIIFTWMLVLASIHEDRQCRFRTDKQNVNQGVPGTHIFFGSWNLLSCRNTQSPGTPRMSLKPPRTVFHLQQVATEGFLGPNILPITVP